MWFNYGRIFAEYMFIKNFREKKFSNLIIIENQKYLKKLKKNKTSNFYFRSF